MSSVRKQVGLYYVVRLLSDVVFSDFVGEGDNDVQSVSSVRKQVDLYYVVRSLNDVVFSYFVGEGDNDVQCPQP